MDSHPSREGGGHRLVHADGVVTLAPGEAEWFIGYAQRDAKKARRKTRRMALRRPWRFLLRRPRGGRGRARRPGIRRRRSASARAGPGGSDDGPGEPEPPGLDAGRHAGARA